MSWVSVVEIRASVAKSAMGAGGGRLLNGVDMARRAGVEIELSWKVVMASFYRKASTKVGRGMVYDSVPTIVSSFVRVRATTVVPRAH